MLTLEDVIEDSTTYKHDCGVYFLIKDGVVIYVGKSKNVHSRVRSHSYSKMFDRYSWVAVEPSKLDEVERSYIKRFRPILNVVNKPREGELRYRAFKPKKPTQNTKLAKYRTMV